MGGGRPHPSLSLSLSAAAVNENSQALRMTEQGTGQAGVLSDLVEFPQLPETHNYPTHLESPSINPSHP